MKLLQSKKFNKEYCARIVHITSFEKHPNPKCTRMKCAIVGGFSISVSLDTKPGWFIYFPVGSQIDGSYLSAMNLFRKAPMNTDQTKTGFFEDNRKVKPIKLQGYPSEGFLMPVSSLLEWYNIQGWEGSELRNLEELNNYDFDSVDDHVLVKRYFVKMHRVQGFKVKGKDASSKISRIVEGQFHLHYDTDSLERMPWVIKPYNLLHISEKAHGTSLCIGNVLTKANSEPKFKAKDSQGHKIMSKRKVVKLNKRNPTEPKLVYDVIYSSRKVIKNKDYNTKVNGGYYGVDIWYEAYKVLKDKLDKGIMVYAEIVGYLPTGAGIQSVGGEVCDYGCEPYKPGEVFTYGKHFDILVYRVTMTNTDGIVHEFSAHEVQLWCKQHDLHAVREYYWGFAKDLYSDLDIHAENWSTQFCKRIKQDQGRFYMELDSPTCKNTVPHEGVVIRIDDGKQAAFKVKSYRFLSKEDSDYDKGVVNIEDAELEADS